MSYNFSVIGIPFFYFSVLAERSQSSSWWPSMLIVILGQCHNENVFDSVECRWKDCSITPVKYGRNHGKIFDLHWQIALCTSNHHLRGLPYGLGDRSRVTGYRRRTSLTQWTAFWLGQTRIFDYSNIEFKPTSRICWFISEYSNIWPICDEYSAEKPNPNQDLGIFVEPESWRWGVEYSFFCHCTHPRNLGQHR